MPKRITMLEATTNRFRNGSIKNNQSRYAPNPVGVFLWSSVHSLSSPIPASRTATAKCKISHVGTSTNTMRSKQERTTIIGDNISTCTHAYKYIKDKKRTEQEILCLQHLVIALQLIMSPVETRLSNPTPVVQTLSDHLGT